MIRQDDRNAEQMKTHNVLVAATDSFLSGWGQASGGASVCAWACKPEHADQVEKWVRNRSDMKRVRIVGNNWRPRNAAHCHVYVVDDSHPALHCC